MLTSLGGWQSVYLLYQVSVQCVLDIASGTEYLLAL